LRSNLLFWTVLCLGVECYSGWSNCTLTVKTGGSVTIPCHYDEKYSQQKKYWFSEFDQSNTYTNTTQKNLSVIDYPDQSLFTVTMRNLTNKHTGLYYCVVETGEQPPKNIINETYLKIQSGKTFCICFNHIMPNSLHFTVLMTGLRLTDSALGASKVYLLKIFKCFLISHSNELLTVWLPALAALLLLLILISVFTWRWRRRPS
uniref:Ig-like domain-containing protein n=1 Tax=Sinocyclocheilus rhinocerous TaxID=307959 RepID=A0A673L259_9TELE